MKALLDGLKALGPTRLAAMGAVALSMLGLLALMVMRGVGNDQMALLYGDLDLRDSGQIVEKLKSQHIPYVIGGGGTQILVPADEVPNARVLLAQDGLPAGGSVGYELFDRGDGMAFTEFQQKINETRALEGELARTIRAIHGIEQARVHLVLPHREPFSHETQDAQAGVMLTMVGAQRLDREGVQAILNLVAAAVPGLRAQNITIIDARGDLLARAGDRDSELGAAVTADKLKRSTELRLARAVEDMLEPSLGMGRVRAEASVTMSYDKVNETQEKYDPDGQVPRSTQTVNTKTKTSEQAGTVSVQNNLPNADAGTQGNGTQESRDEETTNYEIGKTVRTLIRDQPQIGRISLAVMVDGIDTVDASGKPVWKPRDKPDLDRITALVRSAIGYDAKRGDQVDVVSMRFAEEEPGAPATPTVLGMRLEKSDVMRLAQTALFGLIALLALLLVLRPMISRIVMLAPAAAGAGGDGSMSLPAAAMAALGGAPPAMAGGAGGGGQLALAGGGNVAGLLADESMVSISQIEGQMRASSLRKLVELVDKHPDETLTIIRGWMTQDNG